MSRPASERRPLVRRLLAEPMTITDAHRRYCSEYGYVNVDTIRSDLVVMEAAGQVERYNKEYGRGYLWMAV